LASVSRFRIKIIIEGVGEAEGELIRFRAPRTIDAILRRLPVEGRAALWKNAEVYFEIPVKVGLEKPVARVKRGTMAYWPMGTALCIFFEDLEPYSPVNVVGEVKKGLELFRKVRSGAKIRIERIA
jgi:hypothetical protein